MSETKALPKALMLSIAAAQGLLLLVLYQTQELKSWPSETPLVAFPLWTLALVIPVFLLLSLGQGNDAKFLRLTGIFTVVLVLIAAYMGWQAEPYGKFPFSNITLIYGISIGIGCFKALMYIQQRVFVSLISYQSLFTYSWRNFLILAFSGLFVVGFALLLLLWSKLFSVIGIDFFKSLFAEQWFLFPTLGFAFGLGIIIFRGLHPVLDSITTLLQGLIKILLPMALLLAALFVLALPITGLTALWETGVGTTLLLWLTALILFFTNAVYQDSSGVNPYPATVHRLISLALCVLPVICGLSFYGLLLRWQQYGLTVQRGWGFLVWLVLTLFSVGYVWGIVRHRSSWPLVLGKVNVMMGLTLLTLMFVTNSPLLNFREMSIASQLSRVENGSIDLKNLDFYYIHQHLGRSGYLALEKIKAEHSDLDAEILENINHPARRMMGASPVNFDKFWQEIHYRPQAFEVPQQVVQLIERGSASFRPMGPAGNAGEAVLIETDLNADGKWEYVLIRLFDRGDGHQDIFQANYYYMINSQWHLGMLSHSGARQHFFSSIGSGQMLSATNSINTNIDTNIDTATAIKTGQIKIEKPVFNNLKIGEVLFRPQ